MKHTFKKPYHFEGKDYAEVELTLDGLTGYDISAVKREWTAAGNFSAIPATDSDYCAAIAARATKLPIEFFYSLPANEYQSLTQQVSNFLLA